MKTRNPLMSAIVVPIMMTSALFLPLRQHAQGRPTEKKYYPTEFRQAAIEEINYYQGRLVQHEAIPECLPASQDLAGNWGTPTNGLQLSVRFRRNEYLPGEPKQVLILLRNLGSKATGFRTSRLAVQNDFDYTLSRGTNSVTWTTPSLQSNLLVNPHLASVVIGRSLDPGTQLASVLDLNKVFDLNEPGSYSLQVRCHGYGTGGHEGMSNVESGTATFIVVEKLSPSEIASRQEF